MSSIIDALFEAKRQVELLRPKRIEIWLDDAMPAGEVLTGSVKAFGGESFHPDSEEIYIVHPDFLEDMPERETDPARLVFDDGIPVYRAGERVYRGGG